MHVLTTKMCFQQRPVACSAHSGFFFFFVIVMFSTMTCACIRNTCTSHQERMTLKGWVNRGISQPDLQNQRKCRRDQRIIILREGGREKSILHHSCWIVFIPWLAACLPPPPLLAHYLPLLAPSPVRERRKVAVARQQNFALVNDSFLQLMSGLIHDGQSL